MKRAKRKKPSKQASTARTNAPTQAIVRVAPLPEKPWEIQGEQLTILKNAVCKGASDLELQYCLTVARRYKLDPFKKQIWFVPRWDKEADNGKGGKGAHVWIPTVGIDGLLFMSARDHGPEFGSVSEPEFGPILTSGTLKHPEWARVKVFKKGVPEPTTAIAYWDEYSPFDLSKAPFWRNMPRRMISKCATALALRQAYPDLGGVYIAEELERMGAEYTESGRQITSGVPTGGSREAAQAVAQEKIAAAQAGKPIEPEIVSPAQPESKPEPSWPTLTIDWSASLASPTVTGDVEALKPLFDKHCKWGADGFWHTDQRGALAIEALAASMRFKLVQVTPKQSSPKERKETRASAAPATQAPSAGSVLASGVIKQANPQSGKSPRLDVLLELPTSKVGVWMSCFDTALFPALTAGKGQQSELYVVRRTKGDKTFTNITALKRIGVTEYDEFNKPILRTDREPGGKTLF